MSSANNLTFNSPDSQWSLPLCSSLMSPSAAEDKQSCSSSKGRSCWGDDFNDEWQAGLAAMRLASTELTSGIPCPSVRPCATGGGGAHSSPTMTESFAEVSGSPQKPAGQAITDASTAAASCVTRVSSGYVTDDNNLLTDDEIQDHAAAERHFSPTTELEEFQLFMAGRHSNFHSPSRSNAPKMSLSSTESLPGFADFQSSPCYFNLEMDEEHYERFTTDCHRRFSGHLMADEGSVDFGAPVEGFVGSRKTKETSGAFMARVAKRSQFYKTRLCPWLESNQCARRDKCNYAHSKEELRTPPDLSRTRICAAGMDCKSPSCRYAHCLDDLRATNAFYKTRLCRDWQAGYCAAADECRMAHGDVELRHNPAFTAHGSQESCQSFPLSRNLRKRSTTWNAHSTRKAVGEHPASFDRAIGRYARMNPAYSGSCSVDKKLHHVVPKYPSSAASWEAPKSVSFVETFLWRQSITDRRSCSVERSVRWNDDVKSCGALDCRNAHSTTGNSSRASSSGRTWKGGKARSATFHISSSGEGPKLQACTLEMAGLACTTFEVQQTYRDSQHTSFECLRQRSRAESGVQSSEADFSPIAMDSGTLLACASNETLHADSVAIQHAMDDCSRTNSVAQQPLDTPLCPEGNKSSLTPLSWLPKVPASQLLAAQPSFYEE